MHLVTGPEESGNPLENLLGDLLKVMGGGAAAGMPAWWEAARSLAQGVASEGGPEPNPDPLQRIRLSELARVAELHVAETTGLPVASGQTPLEFSPVGRGAWAVRTLEAWRPYLDAMVRAQEKAAGPLGGLAGLSGTDLGFPEGSAEGLQELLSRLALTMGPVLLGLQFGSTAGHLAQRALGQYAVPVPWPPGSELLVVPQNISVFAQDWSLPEDETELWVCIRELTIHTVLQRPHVAERLSTLLAEATDEVTGLHQEMAERLGGELGDPDALQSLMNDPEALLADLMTPGNRRGSAQLTALVTALGGYVDHVTSRIGERLTASAPALSEAWYRYRVADAKGERAAAALFGIDVGREQVDRGSAFVKGVLDRAGDQGLARLWSSERNLPTPAEVDAPGLWLERIDLPQGALPESSQGPQDPGPDQDGEPGAQ